MLKAGLDSHYLSVKSGTYTRIVKPSQRPPVCKVFINKHSPTQSYECSKTPLHFIFHDDAFIIVFFIDEEKSLSVISSNSRA